MQMYRAIRESVCGVVVRDSDRNQIPAIWITKIQQELQRK